MSTSVNVARPTQIPSPSNLLDQLRTRARPGKFFSFNSTRANREEDARTYVFITRDPALDQNVDEFRLDLEEMARLPFDWDTYGSPPVQQTALDAGLLLLRLSAKSGLPTPHIAPISGGGMHLEWEFPHRLMQFVIGAKGEFEYALFRGEDQVVAEGELPSLDERRAEAYMNWFMYP